jgi:hypothetical protein
MLFCFWSFFIKSEENKNCLNQGACKGAFYPTFFKKSPLAISPAHTFYDKRDRLQSGSFILRGRPAPQFLSFSFIFLPFLRGGLFRPRANADKCSPRDTPIYHHRASLPLGGREGGNPPAGITHPDGVRLTAVAVNKARVLRGLICGADAKPAPSGGAKRSGAYSASRGASRGRKPPSERQRERRTRAKRGSERRTEARPRAEAFRKESAGEGRARKAPTPERSEGFTST